jgi:hypothetical protein
MNKIGKRLVLSSLLALAGAGAQASIITIDAGSYAAGTDISSAGRGATLSTYTNLGDVGAHFDPVIVLSNPFGADLAPNAFGHGDLPGPSDIDWNFHNVRGWGGAEACLQAGQCFERFYALHMAFDAPTDYVSVKVHYNQGAYDGSLLRAFDAAGNAIGTCRTWGSGQDRDPQSGLFPNLASPACGTIDRRYDCAAGNCASDYSAFISVPDANIAYVLWGSLDAEGTWATISSLTYRSVPEPSTLALLLGALGFAVVLRRRPVSTLVSLR